MTFCLNLRKFLQVCRNLRTFVAVPENLRFTHLGAKKNCESWVPSQKNRISSHACNSVNNTLLALGIPENY